MGMVLAEVVELRRDLEGLRAITHPAGGNWPQGAQKKQRGWSLAHDECPQGPDWKAGVLLVLAVALIANQIRWYT
jgi:hypothetical protein